MSILVHKLQNVIGADTYTSSNSLVIRVNQTTGSSTPTTGESGTPANTLQKALDTLGIALAASGNEKKIGVIRIESDYIISGTESITKQWPQKCIVECVNDSMITGLKSITDSAVKTTDLCPNVLFKDGGIIDVSASCHKYDILKYVPFSVRSIISYQTTSYPYTGTININIPTGYNVAVGNVLDIQTGWVNAKGTVAAISGSVMSVNVSSDNYKITTDSTGFYRIENYGNNSFTYTKNGESYSITTSLTGFRLPQKSHLILSNIINLTFKDCNFYCIDTETNGITLNNAYSTRFVGCKFEHCGRFVYDSGNDMLIEDCYVNCMRVTTWGANSVMRKNLFKGSTIEALYGVTFEYNEVCYHYEAISSGISRALNSSTHVRQKNIIQYNEFHHIGMLTKGDYGVIYHYGQGDTLIQYNYIHDCVGRDSDGSISGIYFDEGAYGQLARYNIVLNCTRNSYTHFSRGCVFYNNLFAYPLQGQVRYSKATYEGGSSYLANIFYGGELFGEGAFSTMKNDGAMFQKNLLDRGLEEETINIHSNEIGTPPFTSAVKGDFSIDGTYKSGDITMGSTNVRNYNQSTIDSSFFDKKISYGLSSDSKWYNYRGLDLQFAFEGENYAYNKWFILAEISIYNTTNAYLNYQKNK